MAQRSAPASVRLISIIIPTISERKRSFERCVDKYAATTEDFEIIGIPNERACGIAWGIGAEKATGDYLHLTADDLFPHEGWAEAAMEVADRGAIPAATVLNDDQPLNCPVFLEPRYRNTPNVLVPFFSRAQFEVGRWIVPIHYGSDDWITYMAARRGIPVEYTEGYRFDHTAEEEGRLWLNRMKDVPALCSLMEAEGWVPPIYGQLGVGFGWAGWIG
jgi:hypothetical protein